MTSPLHGEVRRFESGQAHRFYNEVVSKRLCREGDAPSRSLPREAIPGGKLCQHF